ncbi:hypothetical protein GOARA_043_00210 [Gordonia araii NBRC 100433]|uniref:DUF3618 domain-containing protein n=1 Tax=Gordonia araii NBRC 100433 TaxID=1073574 RepID=G7H186_9ACTN|nr:DUF3618 domain-containing protein [Gordonia araii]NNG96766.1 DUF3618 domain-containing protein [Gordonia araii NBRC 100433]GAB09546.1 hypothetical protein GOARA_043_00210 [Gordonia araii NBRC 100433]
MANDTERIEQEIAQARENLAATLDQLADRANPQRIAEDAKERAVAVVSTPAVQISLTGVAVLAVLIVLRKLRRRR